MEENTFLLKYIFQDDIYIIEEPEMNATSESKPDKIDSGIEPAAAAEEAQPETFQKPKEPAVQEKIAFFGKNEKRLLILVNDPTNELINQTDLDFLMKIIEGGVKYSKNDFALVNTAKWPLDRILREIPYTSLISFGVENSTLDIKKTKYQVVEKDGTKVLYADDLAAISKDQDKKKMLWSELKTMFNI